MKRIGVCLLVVCLSGVSAMALTANPNTIAFWHMESATPGSPASYIADDTSGGKTTNTPLLLGVDPGYTTGIPTIAVGLGPDGSNALSFNGLNDATNGSIATTSAAWLGQQQFYADFWYKPSDEEAGTNVLVEAMSRWSININFGEPVVTIWHQNNTVDQLWWGNPANDTSTWYHLVCSYDSSTGLLSLSINDVASTMTTATKNLNSTPTSIDVGNKPGFTRNFAGLIDEVYVGTSATPEPATMAIFGLGALFLRRRK